MNKKGFGMPSIFTIFVVIMIIIVLAMAQSHIDTKTIDSTIESLNWTSIGKNVSISIQTVVDNSQNEIVKVIFNIADKGIDFFGYALFAVSKLAMQLARDNPDIINYKMLFALLILSLISPIIYPLFIIIVSLILIIKEYFKVRKEKKELGAIKIHGDSDTDTFK